MKTKCILTLTFTILSIMAYSQVWNTTGNTGGSGEVLGTTSSNDLNFITNSSTTMTLKPSGKLGIGTTTPTSWLEVNSTGTNEAFRTYTASSYDSYWRMYRDGNEYGRFVAFDGGTAFQMMAPRGNLRFATGYTGTTYPAISVLGGSVALERGNTLIGDYSAGGGYDPTARLHIKGNGYNYLFKVESSGQTTPTLQVNETEQTFFTCRDYNGSTSDGAFNFNYAPTGSLSSATTNIYSKTIASTSGNMYGNVFDTHNTASTPGSPRRTVGLITSAESDIEDYNQSIMGIQGFAITKDQQYGYGGYFGAAGQSYGNYGVYSEAAGSFGANIGVEGYAHGDDAY